METALQRMELLIGHDSLATLQKACVMVIGVGGVGSYACEALARSGVGKLILIDGDCVAPSNLNRQIHATFDTIGKAKTAVMKARIETYRNDCDVICHDIFYNEDANAMIFQEPVDFVIDAIDTITSKMDIIRYCLRHKIPFISSTGMANRLDPTQIEVSELMKTSYDPVAKIMRTLVRKQRIKGKIPVIWSKEQPSVQTQIVNEAGMTRKQKMPPASSPFVPSAAGLACASYAMRKLLERTSSNDGLEQEGRASYAK